MTAYSHKELFRINISDPIAIYGTDYNGRDILCKLRSQGYRIECFMDIWTDYLSELDGIPVIDPDKYNGEKKELIVIIAARNPISVANKLVRLGFSKLIYDAKTYRNGENADIIQMHRAFSAIRNGIYKDEKIPFYDGDKMDYRLDNDAIICCDEVSVTAFVHVDLFFIEDSGTFSHIYTEHRNLIRYLESFEGSDNSDLIIQYSENNALECLFGYDYRMSPEERREFTEAQMNLLSLQLDHGIESIVNNPVSARYIDNKFIIDPQDVFRVCFFIIRGIQLLPVKMDKEDYRFWINQGCLDEIRRYMRCHDLLTSYTMIEHPNLYLFPAARDIGKTNRLIRIGAYLSDNNVTVNNMSVLDVGSYYGAVSRFFYRMGGRITSIEYNIELYEFGKLINKLMHCEGIESLYGDARDLNRKNEFHITVMLTVLYWHLDTKAGIDLLKAVDEMTRDMLIWESGDEAEKEKRFIIENSSFRRYKKICSTIGTGKVRELGVWTR